MSNDIVIMSKDEQINTWDFAVKLSKSKMVPLIFQGKPEDTFVTVLMGRELGISPIMALTAIVVIQGTVTLKVQTMGAVIRSKCPEAIIQIKADHENRTVTVEAKRNKDDVGYTSYWDMDMAKQMGLAGKDNWLKQPMNMLKARALSDAYRTVFPDILLGLYSFEEITDDNSAIAPKNVAGVVLEALKEDAKVIYEEQRKPEDSQLGPQFLIENGTYRGKRLYEVDPIDLEEYGETIRKRKDLKPWEKTLLQAIEDLFTNMHLYKEQIYELNEATT
jgi:hypothetical protein